MFKIPSDEMDLHEKITVFVNRRDGHYDALYHESTYTPDPSKPCVLERFVNADPVFVEYMDFI